MNLDITRTEKTSAVQNTLVTLPTDSWVWPSKTAAA